MGMLPLVDRARRLEEQLGDGPGAFAPVSRYVLAVNMVDGDHAPGSEGRDSIIRSQLAQSDGVAFTAPSRVVLAWFASAASAVTCALEIQTRSEAMGFAPVRCAVAAEPPARGRRY